jgi:hypothetical protein
MQRVLKDTTTLINFGISKRCDIIICIDPMENRGLKLYFIDPVYFGQCRYVIIDDEKPIIDEITRRIKTRKIDLSFDEEFMLMIGRKFHGEEFNTRDDMRQFEYQSFKMLRCEIRDVIIRFDLLSGGLITMTSYSDICYPTPPS